MYQSIPAIIATKPTAITGFTPMRVTSACARPAQRTAVPAVATNVTPVLSADQPSTCCTYSVRMKKFDEDDGAEQQPRDVRAGDRADAEDAERHQRILRARLDHEERDQQRGGDRQARDRPRPSSSRGSVRSRPA